jgi:hypothetical protein
LPHLLSLAQAEARLALGQSSIMTYPTPFIPCSYSPLTWLDASYIDMPSMNVSLDPPFSSIDVSCEAMKQTLDELYVKPLSFLFFLLCVVEKIGIDEKI